MLNDKRRSFFSKAGIGIVGSLALSLIPAKKVLANSKIAKLAGAKSGSLIHPLAIKRNKRG